ncbi:MAG: acetyltransferase [Ruminococcaceae bacterium]|nr:acetyltransferase [Oscillospiraceae bacterium]
MNNRLIIIGAGGHGRVIADNAYKNGYKDISFIDDFAEGLCMGYKIIGKTEDIEKYDDGKTDFVIGVGDNLTRRKLAERFSVNWISLVHPSAQIAMDAVIGEGTVIMAGAVINAGAIIGKHCIINSSSIIEHDNTIGAFAHISPGVSLGGTVSVGEETHIGIGATVINNINICSGCIIGAGAVVISDIAHSGTYVGVPVKGEL